MKNINNINVLSLLGMRHNMMKVKDGDISLIPPQLHLPIIENINKNSILRTYGNVIKIDGNSIQIPCHTLNSYKPRWLKEGESAAANVDTKFNIVNITPHTVYLNFDVTRDFLEDMGDNIINYIEDNVSESLAQEEDLTLLRGKATDNMQGLLTLDIDRIESHDSGALISQMYYRLPNYFKKSAIWITNEKFMSNFTADFDNENMARFDSSTKSYIIPKIMGIPVIITHHDLGEDSIILVNLRRAYLAVEKGDLTIKEIAAEPFKVNLCFSGRMGGAVINEKAICIGKITESEMRS